MQRLLRQTAASFAAQSAAIFLTMAMIVKTSGPGWRAGRCAAALALLCAAACGNETGNAGEDIPQPDTSNNETALPSDAETSSPPPRAPVAEEAQNAADRDSRAAGFYRLAWSGDKQCEGLLSVLNDAHVQSGKAADYADAQARDYLATSGNVDWIDEGAGVQSATLDYFNDGTSRRMERRQGMLSGNRITALWTDNGSGDFQHLDFGHAGANTNGIPQYDNLHTKLTYSVSDIVVVRGRYFTLVAPLADFEKSGVVFAMSWRLKDGAAAPYEAQHYYPVVSCVAEPAKSNSEEG